MRNLTVALAPDDFKPVDKLEAQVPKPDTWKTIVRGSMIENGMLTVSCVDAQEQQTHCS